MPSLWLLLDHPVRRIVFSFHPPHEFPAKALRQSEHHVAPTGGAEQARKDQSQLCRVPAAQSESDLNCLRDRPMLIALDQMRWSR